MKFLKGFLISPQKERRKKLIRIGTRGSKLALYQANRVKERLLKEEIESEIIVIKTSGDKIKDKPLLNFGGKGLFVKEIQETLMEDKIDIAVHSLKDYPIENPKGLTIGCILEREDVRDAIVLQRENELEKLSRNPIVGTGSLRRKYQLKLIKPNWTIVSVRGNVDTRIRKVEEGQFDAVVLAGAGLKRLKKEDYIKGYFEVYEIVPAVGQGAIAIEVKEKNNKLVEILQKIEDKKARKEVEAERDFLRNLGGNCTTPLGVNCKIENGKAKIYAYLSSFTNDRWIKDELEGDEKESVSLSRELFERFLRKDALKML